MLTYFIFLNVCLNYTLIANFHAIKTHWHDHFKDSTQQSWTQSESSEHICTVGSFVELNCKSDHIARFIATQLNKTVLLS